MLADASGSLSLRGARAGTHTPWSYVGQTVNVYRSLSRLHERAAPLTLRLWRGGDRTGLPPTRPLWLQFPGDAKAATATQQWMLGLVVHGPRTRSVRAPLTVLPYFFRCGTDPIAKPASR